MVKATKSQQFPFILLIPMIDAFYSDITTIFFFMQNGYKAQQSISQYFGYCWLSGRKISNPAYKTFSPYIQLSTLCKFTLISVMKKGCCSGGANNRQLTEWKTVKDCMQCQDEMENNPINCCILFWQHYNLFYRSQWL